MNKKNIEIIQKKLSLKNGEEFKRHFGLSHASLHRMKKGKNTPLTRMFGHFAALVEETNPSQIKKYFKKIFQKNTFFC